MKKIFSACLIILAITQIANSQTNNITGIVKSDKGSPVHYVFVHDQKSANGTFTDSLGNFSIMVNPGSVIQFSAVGYSDVAMDGAKLSNNMQVTLTSNGSSGPGSTFATSTTVSTTPIANSYLANENISNAGAGGGTLNGLGHQKGNVHGNRYLFEDFAHGFIISPQGALTENPTYFYDYDKMGGGIMITMNNGPVSQLDNSQIKTITLFSKDDKTYVLTMVPTIDAAHYVQILASGPKYNIYKATKTTFVKSDFVNNGVTSHGNDYDEFVDDFTYYLLDVQTNQVQKIAPKKKALKAAFTKDADKVNKYLADHSGDIDDGYLANLGSYMNQ